MIVLSSIANTLLDGVPGISTQGCAVYNSVMKKADSTRGVIVSRGWPCLTSKRRKAFGPGKD